jgi:hypothetical protein
MKVDPPTPEFALAQRTWLRPLVRSLLHDEHDADDVEQETWLAALSLVTAVSVWNLDPPQDAGAHVGEDAAASASPAARPKSPEPVADPVVRSRVDTGALASAPDTTSIEVRVRNKESGEPVPGATVLFARPGFVYADLPPEQRERYSRCTESYLNEFGMSRITDESGSTRIPIEAACLTVVARKENLYGTRGLRTGEEILELLVSVHHTLVLETVDRFGTPVPRVKVVCQLVANGIPTSRWTLGTTDRNGRLTQVLEPPSAKGPHRIWLHAELLGGSHGREVQDPTALPTYPVRLTIPTTGTVRARVVDASGARLDRAALEGLHAEVTVDPENPTAQRHGSTLRGTRASRTSCSARPWACGFLRSSTAGRSFADHAKVSSW